MKLLLIVCDAAFENLLLRLLEENSIKEYTKIDKVLGVGKSSEPHLDSHIWPGYHNFYIIAIHQGEKYIHFKSALVNLKEKLKNKGFKVFVLDLSEII